MRYWIDEFSTLHIDESGRDFCDECTSLKDGLVRIDPIGERRQATTKILADHRQKAKQKFVFYRQCKLTSNVSPDGPWCHIVFDFAEVCASPETTEEIWTVSFCIWIEVWFVWRLIKYRKNQLHLLPS